MGDEEVEFKGSGAMLRRAERCADVLTPTSPDPSIIFFAEELAFRPVACRPVPNQAVFELRNPGERHPSNPIPLGPRATVRTPAEATDLRNGYEVGDNARV